MIKSNICLAFAIVMITVSCKTTTSTQKMSFEEARDVVLSMQSIPMEPPPRKMNDILDILKSSQNDKTDHINVLIRRAEMVPSDQQSPEDLYQFHKSRGSALYELSRFNECRENIRAAIAYSDKAKIGDGALYQRLAELEMLAGRYASALDLSIAATKTGPYSISRTSDEYRISGWRMGPFLSFQSRIHHRMGNFSQAEKAIRNAKAAYEKVPARSRYSLILDGGELDMGNENDILAAEAEMLEAQGRYDQAHELRARVLNYHYSKRMLKPLGSIYAQMAMATNLMGQNQLVLAEKVARTAVMDAVSASGKYSGITADAVQTLGEIILAKGDLKNADILATTQVDILTRLGLSIEEDIMVRAQLFNASVMVVKEEFSAAMIAYDLAMKGMTNNPYLFKRYAHRNLGLILSLIQNDRVSEANGLIRETRHENLRFKSGKTHDEVQIQALEAMALQKNQQTTLALKQFLSAVPGLVVIIHDPNSSYSKRRFADILLQFYIDMLLEIYQKQKEQAYSISIADEIFKLMGARYSRVNSAIGQSSARAASLADPELAELVRQEQDASMKIKSLEGAFYNASAALDGDQSGALQALKRSIQTLTQARVTILAHVEKKFPRYINYIQPTLPTMAQVQAQLSSGEAFVAIWTLVDKTCVWAIPQNGDPVFTIAEMGKSAMQEKILVLRKALKPNVRKLGEIPEFDVETAYEIYDHLLRPVASGWEKAPNLLIVINGPLDQVPLTLLPTKKVKLSPDVTMRFEQYRHVPWLIRKATVTRLPSADALLTLRTLPTPNPGREPFVGFGDPVFSLAQLKAAPVTYSKLSQRGSSPGNIYVRGIRISNKGEDIDSGKLTSVRIEQLCRLPDTADEIRQIADSLEADAFQSVFIGKNATETTVKSQDLSRKKVIAFATHALLPGDLDGLTQPALALSAPEVTNELDEDGLLTLGEILTLKLDADLVVLSACDTGAGDSIGNEAISGLGQAFFYSGARALMVTMWPVETTSANKLTTEIFRYQKTNKSLSRARAHQKSILKLIEDLGLEDNTTGKIVASYAHPFFWAPFVIVGDGR